jgi:chromosome segregation ATPase
MAETQGDRFARAMKIDPPTPLQQMARNPLQTALDNYHVMEAEVSRVRAEDQTLRAENQALLAEVNMLREAFERSDGDRIRLQAISSTLLGRLLAINDTIAGAVRASVKDGIEAAAQEKPAVVFTEQASTEPQEAAQRADPNEPISIDHRPLASPAPPQVEWGGVTRR